MEGMTTELKEETEDVTEPPEVVDLGLKIIGDDGEEVGEATTTSNYEGLEGRAMSTTGVATIYAFSSGRVINACCSGRRVINAYCSDKRVVIIDACSE
ncbi:uncharacterized protein A4U43_C02F14200 [Asparagus officinalis]|uniref:Uncharacterized protein n=1 Tax=Asparagus officinalis TaxID=4686 RepID=A0A5P1FM96_ASPOF|nr:uncharacterized protein A4U43_C02F14200 [Asparagus officinalis]